MNDFPPNTAVAASGKDPSNCTLGSPNKVHTLRMTRRECEHGASNYDLPMRINYIKSVVRVCVRQKHTAKLNKIIFFFADDQWSPLQFGEVFKAHLSIKKETRQTCSSVWRGFHLRKIPYSQLRTAQNSNSLIIYFLQVLWRCRKLSRKKVSDEKIHKKVI